MKRIPTGFNEGRTIKVKIKSVNKLRPSKMDDLHENCGNKIDWNKLMEEFIEEHTDSSDATGYYYVSTSPENLFNWFKNKIEK